MKKILIMGASSGIGLRVAEEFAKRGVMTGLAARHAEPLQKLQHKYPDTVVYSSIDVTVKSATTDMHSLIEKMGGMDIYFHVAGIGYDNPMLNPEREAEIIDTNATGFARMLSTAYCYFRDNKKKGRIAAVTSVAGTNGIGRLSAYSASKKCAQTYMTALEQRAHNEKVEVDFTDIRPGWIRTPLLLPDSKYPLEMTLDYVVPLIIKAVVRHPRVAIIDRRWDILVRLWQCIPNALWSRMNIPVTYP